MRPQTKEEAWAIIESLQRQLEILTQRVDALERGKRKPKAEADKTDQNHLADVWIRVHGGKVVPPWVFSKKAGGMKLVNTYTLPRVLPVLEWYLRTRPVDYVNVSKLVGAFETYEAEMKRGLDVHKPWAGNLGSIDAATEGMAIARRHREAEETAERGIVPRGHGPADRSALPGPGQVGPAGDRRA